MSSLLPRRRFLQLSGATAASLLIGIPLSGCSPSPFPGSDSDALTPNAFLRVTPESRVILQLNKFDMGQGISEGFRCLVAEELGLCPSDITLEMASLHPDLKDPEMRMIAVGGSSSIRNFYQPLREAAATVRELLLDAAALEWQLPKDALRCEDGLVQQSDSARRITIGALVERARTLPVPSSVSLVADDALRWIGTEREPSADARAKVTGARQFGIDLPAPLTAVLLRCPQAGGRLASVDERPALAVSGVQAVVPLEHAVAVVAKDYWSARKGAAQLQPQWDKGPLAGVTTAQLRANQLALLDSVSGRKVFEHGSAPAEGEGRELSADYHAPFLAHAAMEPMNALADVRPDSVTLWSGIQGLELAIDAVSRALQRPREQVRVHPQYMGGGFGRRIVPDCCVEAALLSQRMHQPVKVVWSREDDMRHDFYRPMATARLRARLSGDEVLSIRSKVACPGVIAYAVPDMAAALLPAWMPSSVLQWAGGLVSGRDPSATEGLSDLPYALPHQRCDYAWHDAGVPVGFWRSVGHSQNAFFIESFVDELANLINEDPVALRRRWLREQPRLLGVLERVAREAGWGAAPAGRYQGIAVHASFQTCVAQVAEISIADDKIRVHRVTAAVDCGRAINPRIVRAQIEGGIVFGLTAALYGEIQLEDGAVAQSNFHDYPLLRLDETPAIDVHIIDSNAAPTGVGEPGVPPLAPALANAVFAATGQRLRSLPLRLAAA